MVCTTWLGWQRLVVCKACGNDEGGAQSVELQKVTLWTVVLSVSVSLLTLQSFLETSSMEDIVLALREHCAINEIR